MDMYGGAWPWYNVIIFLPFDDVVAGVVVGEDSWARRRHTHLKSVATLMTLSRRIG
jgi:hypothetical protein